MTTVKSTLQHTALTLALIVNGSEIKSIGKIICETNFNRLFLRKCCSLRLGTVWRRVAVRDQAILVTKKHSMLSPKETKNSFLILNNAKNIFDRINKAIFITVIK